MKQRRDALLARIAVRDVEVGIIGLGHVGLPLMLAATARGFRVRGFDNDDAVVTGLNAGECRLCHVPQSSIELARHAGLFTATVDFSCLVSCDIIIICVPTPLARHREPDLSYVVDAAKQTAAHLQQGQLVVLASTSYPGTTAEVVRPVLEAKGLQAGVDFFLAYAVEREDPGNTSFSAAQTPRVVGADDASSLAITCAFYAAFVNDVIPVSSAKAAEAVKIVENVFRAVNVALVNELKIVYAKMGIDIFEVIAAAKTKPFGYMPFYPGPGVGGHCIPIDPFYLTWKARELQASTRLVELAGEINAEMPGYVVSRVAAVLKQERGRDLSFARVLVVGVAYKRDVNDIRESPAIVVMDLLQQRGALVDYYDPLVETIPPIRDHLTLSGMKSIALVKGAVSQYDALVILTDHSDIDWAALVEAAALVVDTRNVGARINWGHHKIFSA